MTILGFKTELELEGYLKCLRNLKVGDQVEFYCSEIGGNWSSFPTGKTFPAEVVIIFGSDYVKYADTKFEYEPKIYIGSKHSHFYKVDNFRESIKPFLMKYIHKYERFLDIAGDIRIAKVIKQ